VTYPDAITYLGQARRFGMKLGLEPMRELAQALGNPQDSLRFIHLAGTNGKGSTAAFCESCLRAAGLRVGLFTSPHLVSVRERIQINRVQISEDDFAQGMAIVRGLVEKSSTQEATYFELMTALALWYFAREKIDWIVWETGLGGRLDATNIVAPELCIITNIGLDHQQYLGPSLRDIAAEKAGIIKRGVPVISAVEAGDAFEVIQQRAKDEGASLTLVYRDMEIGDLGLRGGRQMAAIDGWEFALGLMGRHQVSNAACAVEAMWQIRSRDPQSFGPGRDCNIIPDEAIARGLRETVWPGRFEVLSEKPLIVLDGAHNAAGMAMLVETWRAFLATRFGWSAAEIASRAHIVFGSVADKDISEIAQLLRPIAGKISLVRLANERTAEPAQLAQFFTGLHCSCYDSVSAVWNDLAKGDSTSVTLITGSLFLVGEMLALRQGNAEEYQLNERLEKQVITR
jgi:dihydrofolate synthase / folylpolyglutamate synthase